MTGSVARYIVSLAHSVVHGASGEVHLSITRDPGWQSDAILAASIGQLALAQRSMWWYWNFGSLFLGKLLSLPRRKGHAPANGNQVY